MRRYQVQYSTGRGSHYSFSQPFDTFEEAEKWAEANCRGWWTITNCYR